MTRGTLREPAAGTADDATALGTAPDTGIHPGSRAELKELSDNALLGKLKGLPKDSELRAAVWQILRGPLPGAGPVLRDCATGTARSPPKSSCRSATSGC